MVKEVKSSGRWLYSFITDAKALRCVKHTCLPSPFSSSQLVFEHADSYTTFWFRRPVGGSGVGGATQVSPPRNCDDWAALQLFIDAIVRYCGYRQDLVPRCCDVS